MIEWITIMVCVGIGVAVFAWFIEWHHRQKEHEVYCIACITPNKTESGALNIPGTDGGFEIRVVLGTPEWGGPRMPELTTPSGEHMFYWIEPWEEEDDGSNRLFFGDERGLYWRVPTSRECIEYTGEQNDKFPYEILNTTMPLLYTRIEKYYNITEGVAYTEGWNPVFTHRVIREVKRGDVERTLAENESLKSDKRKLLKELQILEGRADYEKYIERKTKEIGVAELERRVGKLEGEQ